MQKLSKNAKFVKKFKKLRKCHNLNKLKEIQEIIEKSAFFSNTQKKIQTSKFSKLPFVR